MAHDGIVVLGCPRSGTTLLRRLMDAHPNISAPGETYILSSCARFLSGEKVVDGMEIGVVNGLGFLGFDEGDVVGGLREFAFGFRAKHAAREGKSRWLEKTAIDAFHVKAIERLCGDHADFICVVRNGLDVACSMLDWSVKAQAFPPELHDYVKDTPRLMEAFCKAWAESTNEIMDFAARHEGNAILIRYEDLIEDPEVVLGSVFDKIGEEMPVDLLERAFEAKEPKGFSDWKAFSKTSLSSQSVGRSKSLSKDTLSMLADIVNPTLERAGYALVKSGKARSDEVSRKRYEMGLVLQGLKSEG